MQAYDFTCGGEFAQGNSVQLDISYDNDAGNPPGATFGTLTVDAYDWIALELMEDIPELGLKSGQGLVVPGILAQWLFHWMNSPEAALTEPEAQLISQVVLFLATDGAASILEGAFVAEAGQVAVLEARIVGQDMRGVMVSESVETPIVLEMEADVNGVFTYNKLKWEQGYQADAQLVGRMPNPKFKSQGGDVVQRELLVVRTSAGICVRDATAVVGNNIFYSSSDALALTYDAGNLVNQSLRTQIFQLYNQRNWSALETLFNQNGLNVYNGKFYPPGNGGFNTKIVQLKKGMKFDRYQENVSSFLPNGDPLLKGSFTSPIQNNQPYPYSSRALAVSQNQNALYYEIEILEDLPFGGEQAEVIPWFGQNGRGVQTKFKFDNTIDS